MGGLSKLLEIVSKLLAAMRACGRRACCSRRGSRNCRCGPSRPALPPCRPPAPASHTATADTARPDSDRPADDGLAPSESDDGLARMMAWRHPSRILIHPRLQDPGQTKRLAAGSPSPSRGSSLSRGRAMPVASRFGPSSQARPSRPWHAVLRVRIRVGSCGMHRWQAQRLGLGARPATQGLGLNSVSSHGLQASAARAEARDSC